MAVPDVSQVAPGERALDRQVQVVEVVSHEVEAVQQVCFPDELSHDHEQGDEHHGALTTPPCQALDFRRWRGPGHESLTGGGGLSGSPRLGHGRMILTPAAI